MSWRGYESDPELKPGMHGQVEVLVESQISGIAQLPIVYRGGEKEDLPRLRLKLYKAALRGDWNAAESALRSDKSAGYLEINGRGDGPLHVAALVKQTEFVHKLVKYFNEGDLEFKNKNGETAFCSEALSGDVEIAKVMYKKNENLPTIRNCFGMTPFEVAAWKGNRKMVEYLYKITRLQDFEAQEITKILVATIDSEMYGFKRIYGSLEKRRQAGQLVKKLCEQILTLEDLEISNLFSETPILNDATKIGNVEFLTLLISSFPDLIWTVDSKHNSIFHVAVIYRQEKVFSLIYDIGAIKDFCMFCTNDFENNILHLAAKLAPSSRLNSVSGAALQMQRELLWFKVKN